MARTREQLDAIINGYNSNPFRKLDSYNVSDAGRKETNDFNEASAERGMLNAQSAGPDQASSNWNHAIANTQGRGDALMNDPRITAALDLLQKQMGEGPYTDKIVNQMSNRSADRNAAIAANQGESLRNQMANTGGNAMDPSYQAALRAADTNRAVQTSTDRGDLESKSTLANYSAQNQAANQLAGQRMQQHNSANTQYNQAAQLYANQQISGGHQNAYGSSQPQSLNYQAPSYEQMSYDQGPQQSYAAQPQQQQPTAKPVAKSPVYGPFNEQPTTEVTGGYTLNPAQNSMYNQIQGNKKKPAYDPSDYYDQTGYES